MSSSFARSTTLVPVFKPKRNDLLKVTLDPFPNLTRKTKFKAVFTGCFLIEVEDEDIKEIFNSGCYGRGSNSRSTPACLRYDKEPVILPLEIPETLILGYEEGFFLSFYLDVLEIFSSDGNIFTKEELFHKLKGLNPFFIRRMVAYIYLKSKNWIIRDGTKFGSDFLIYKKSIRIFHASFIVHVIDDCQKSQSELQGHHRTAENSAKDLLYLTVHPPKLEDTDVENTLEALDSYKVTELIIRRFNFISFTTK